jgi:DNA/RNA-binding domain of Phe-tRNA-synthetase-like protein
MTTPYENLANAIVLQAVKDYRDALKRLKKKPQQQSCNG